MKIQRLKKIQTGDPELQQMQQNTEDAFRQVEECPKIRGQAIKRVTIAAAPAVTEVQHKLGRMPEGWEVSRLSAGGVVYEAGESTIKILNLTATVQVVVDLWVY